MHSSGDASQLAGADAKRLAIDGRPYTKTEFLQHYRDGERRWANAGLDLVGAPLPADGSIDGVA